MIPIKDKYNVCDVLKYPKAHITISELYFIPTILGAIAKNCWLWIFFLWSIKSHRI